MEIMEKNELLPEEQKEREITVYNTVGSCEVTFKSKAKTLAELKKDLDGKGVTYQGMKMVIGETQDELVNETDILISQDISLFLTPIKVKSGE